MVEKAKVKAASAAAAAVMDQTSSADIPPSESEAKSDITDEMIAERAYFYWEARGCMGGSPDEDWYRAVEELTSQSEH